MSDKSPVKKVDHRPWGHYEILFVGANFQVKRVELKPKARLSLQKHLKRSEKWTVVQGEGLATLDERDIPVKRESVIEVPVGAVHRMANTGTIPLIFIEVQCGEYLGEDDIIRFADDYNRK